MCASTATSDCSTTTSTRSSTPPKTSRNSRAWWRRKTTSRSSCTRASSCSDPRCELVTLPDDLAARLEGKSSLGRLGLLTHSTAGFVDPGFSGHVTLELSNVATLPIKLWPGMKIGQLCFIKLSSPAEHPYGSAAYSSRYQNQRGPTASRSFQNFYRTDTHDRSETSHRDESQLD